MAPITAVLVASTGGARLRASLESVAWTARVAVIDPTGGADLSALPSGTARWTAADLGACGDDGWLLLLAEGEHVSAPLRAALEQAVRGGAEGARAFRLPLACAAWDATLEPRAAPVRVCRGAPDGAGLSPQGQLALRTRGRAARLAVPVRVARAPTLLEGVHELDRDAAAWAALDGAAGAVGVLHTIRIGTAGLLRTLAGRGSGRLGWGRLVLAVQHGYRAVLTLAKRWETQRGPAA